MNPSGDEPKSFDVKNKPAPSHTSRPVIVGHHPAMPDPMLQPPGQTPPAKPDIYPAAKIVPPPPPPSVQGQPQPATQPKPENQTSQPPLPEELKVHLPAGKAAKSQSKLIWAIAVIAAVVAGGALGYLVIK